jgi:hypothetical protein
VSLFLSRDKVFPAWGGTGPDPVKPSKNVTEGRYRRAIHDVTGDGWPMGRRSRLPNVQGVLRCRGGGGRRRRTTRDSGGAEAVDGG